MKKFKKKILKLLLIHDNKNNILIKKYRIFIKNNLVINKNLIIYLKLMFYKINKFIKNRNKNIIKIIILLIWKSNHFKELIILIKNMIKINKKIKIKTFKNLGNFKNFKKNINKLLKK